MTRVQACVIPLGVLTVMTIGCANQSQAPAMSPEQMVAAADTLDTAFVDAFNKGDATAMSALYWNSPEVVSVAPDVLQPASGIGALRDANTRMLTGMKGARIEITEHHQVPAGEVVLGWGTFKLIMPGGGGEILGRFTDVKGQRDGKWVYLMDHASVPLMPPAPAPAATTTN